MAVKAENQRTLYLMPITEAGKAYMNRPYSPIPTQTQHPLVTSNAALTLNDAPVGVTTPLESKSGSLRQDSTKLDLRNPHASSNCGNKDDSIVAKLNFFGKAENRRLDLIIDQLNNCITSRQKDSDMHRVQDNAHLWVIQTFEEIRNLMIDIILPRFEFIMKVRFQYASTDPESVKYSSIRTFSVAAVYIDGSIDIWDIRVGIFAGETNRPVKYVRHVNPDGVEEDPNELKFHDIARDLTNAFNNTRPLMRLRNVIGIIDETLKTDYPEDIKTWFLSIKDYISAIRGAGPSYINFDYLRFNKNHWMILTVGNRGSTPEFWKTSTSAPVVTKILGGKRRKNKKRKTRRNRKH